MPKYIDAEKIKWHTLYFNGGKQEITYKDEIDALPSEDVTPIIHAKWEPAFMGLELVCSNCKKSPHNLMQYDYCPFCNAKMSKCDEGYQTVVCKAEDNKDDN